MKKLLSVISAMVVMFAMGGCESEKVEQVSETVVETAQSEKLTFDDINVIEINGKNVSLPFKIEKLGEGYSIVEEQGYIKAYPAIYYNGQCLAFVEFDENNSVISVSFPSDSLEREDIKLYGLSNESDYGTIIDSIGVPTIEKEMLLIYQYEQGELSFSIDDETSKINIIQFSLGNVIE